VVLNKLLRAFQQRQGAARRRIRKLTSQTPFCNAFCVIWWASGFGRLAKKTAVETAASLTGTPSHLRQVVSGVKGSQSRRGNLHRPLVRQVAKA